MVHFKVTEQVRKLASDGRQGELHSILKSYNDIYKFKSVIHKLQESYVLSACQASEDSPSNFEKPWFNDSRRISEHRSLLGELAAFCEKN